MGVDKSARLNGFDGFSTHAALGGASEAISKTVCAPLERTKLLLQNQGELLRQGKIERPFNGMVDCMQRIMKLDGVAALWQGNLVNVMRAVPAQALNFAFKSAYAPIIQDKLARRDHPSYFQQFSVNVATGSAAGASSLAFVYHLDLARTRLSNDTKGTSTSHKRQFRNMRDVYSFVYRNDGIRGLYTGFVPGILGIVVYRGLYFGLYDSIKPHVLTGSLENNFLASFGVAYFSTTTAELCSYFLDTLKRRMMLTAGEPNKYRGMFHLASHIIRREGVKSLFSGSWVNILRGVAGAATLSLYDRFTATLADLKSEDSNDIS